MIYTRSSFIYDIQITSSNYNLDFLEGSTKYAAKLIPGKYTLATIVKEVSKALSNAGLLDYSVSIDRTTRKITISAPSEFTLLVNGDHAGASCLSVLGITSNKVGAIIEGDLAIGKEYRPQSYLQDWVSPEDWLEYISASRNESSGGVAELVALGEKKLCQFNIEFITNRPMGGVLETNPQGVEQAREFCRYVGTIGAFDFLPDRNDPAKFYTLIVEKTGHSSLGAGFRLYEMSKTAFNDIYETKTITCRVIE